MERSDQDDNGFSEDESPLMDPRLVGKCGVTGMGWGRRGVWGRGSEGWGVGGRGRGVFGCVCLFMVQHNFHLSVLTTSNISTPVSLSLSPPPLSLPPPSLSYVLV